MNACLRATLGVGLVLAVSAASCLPPVGGDEEWSFVDIAGSVRRADGEAIAGVDVAAWAGNESTCLDMGEASAMHNTTDTTGRYRVHLVRPFPGDFCVELVATPPAQAGLLSATIYRSGVNFRHAQPESLTVDIVLSPGPSRRLARGAGSW